MKQIKIDGTAYQVPTQWSEVTYAQFLYWQYNKPDEIDLVAHLSGIPRETFLAAERSLFLQVQGYMTFLGQPLPEIQTDNFTFEGLTYHYDHLSEACLAQYVDVSTRLEEFDGEEVYKAYPYITAILYLPSGEKYTSKVSAARAEAFHRLPVTVCMAVVGFFLSRRQILTHRTHLSQTLQAIHQKITPPSKSLPSTGDGSARS